jgi:hypothetical protein
MKVVFASFMLARVDKRGENWGWGIFYGDNLSDISRDIVFHYSYLNPPENKIMKITSYEIL